MPSPVEPGSDGGKGVGGVGACVASASAAGLYFGMALILTLVNRALFTTFGFRELRLLALFQLAAALALRVVLGAIGAAPLPPVTAAALRRYVPQAVVGVFSTVATFSALRGANLVLFGMLRRTNIIFTLVAQSMLAASTGAPRPSNMVAACCVTVAAGTILSSAVDLTLDLSTYAAALVANICSAADLVLTKSSPVADSSMTVVYYSSLISVPLLSLVCYTLGDFDRFVMIEFAPGLREALLASVAAGATIRYAIVLNTRVNSPLAHVVVGQLKSAVVFVIGFIALRHAGQMTHGSTAGALTSLFGAAAYAIVRHLETQRSKSQADGGIGKKADLAKERVKMTVVDVKP